MRFGWFGGSKPVGYRRRSRYLDASRKELPDNVSYLATDKTKTDMTIEEL